MIHETISLSGAGEGALLTTYLREETENIGDRSRRAVIICPGGAYERVSDREGEPVALRYLAEGLQAFVLSYSTALSRFPSALKQLSEAIAYVRERAQQWQIAPHGIMVCGFSAGGHLAGCMGAFWNTDWLFEHTGRKKEMIRPNGLLLCYPVVTFQEFGHKPSIINLLGESPEQEMTRLCSLENQITDQMPPVFLWHTLEDGTVPVENSFLLAKALRDAGVSFEFHMYPRGCHGISLADEESKKAGEDGYVNSHVAGWFDLSIEWIRRSFVDFVNEK